MSDAIFITGVVIHARHGVMDHETEVGQTKVRVREACPSKVHGFKANVRDDARRQSVWCTGQQYSPLLAQNLAKYFDVRGFHGVYFSR